MEAEFSNLVTNLPNAEIKSGLNPFFKNIEMQHLPIKF